MEDSEAWLWGFSFSTRAAWSVASQPSAGPSHHTQAFFFAPGP